jgi:hypothetical protein
MEHITELELEEFITDFKRSIYKGLIATHTSLEQVTIHDTDGKSSIELTLIPLEVWQHINIDGQAIIEAIKAMRNEG